MNEQTKAILLFEQIMYDVYGIQMQRMRFKVWREKTSRYSNKYMDENQKLVNMVVQNLIKIDWEADASLPES